METAPYKYAICIATHTNPANMAADAQCASAAVGTALALSLCESGLRPVC